MGKHKLLTKQKEFSSTTSNSLKHENQNRKSKKKRHQFGAKPTRHYSRKPEEPTPWMKLKEAFLEKEKEIHERKVLNKEGKEEFLDKRNKNYKKFLIQEKQKEETIWEDFSAADNESRPSVERVENKNQEEPNKELNSDTKKKYKAFITKATSMAMNTSFTQALNDLKYRGVKRYKNSET